MYFAELLAQCFRVIEDGVADFRRVALTAIADARNELDIYLIRLVSHIAQRFRQSSCRLCLKLCKTLRVPAIACHAHRLLLRVLHFCCNATNCGEDAGCCWNDHALNPEGTREGYGMHWSRTAEGQQIANPAIDAAFYRHAI